MIVALKPAREAAGMTQRQLAERAGVTTRTVIRIEVDADHRPSVHTVKVLADALGVTINDLIHDEDGTDPQVATPEVPENAESAPPLSAVPGRS